MNRTRILCALVALVVLLGAFASSAMAQVRPTTLSDSQEPGSVIVFPKFITGNVTVPGEPANQSPTPRTEFELGVVCPKGLLCPEGQKIKIRLHYVCGNTQFSIGFNRPFPSMVCPSTDFDAVVTVNGKLVFNPGGNIAGNLGVSPQPQCERGYLIAYVIDTSDRPIKFDGLIGDAVLRETGTAVGAYTAIPIQADPALVPSASNPPLITLGAEGQLIFDGGPGHYQAVSGVVIGDVAFDRPANAGQGPRTTYLTLLTLDVRQNRPNNPVFVDLDFFNSNEFLVSGFTEFVCWQEVPLSGLNLAIPGVPLPFPEGASPISPSLTGPFMQTRKGLFVSSPAVKLPFTFGADPDTGRVTLLGLIEVLEGTGLASGADRQFFYQMLNDSVPVPTSFFPN